LNNGFITMAEALGIAAAVVQLTQLSVQVLVTGYGFIAKASNAPSEVRKLLTEVSALDCVLSRLEDNTVFAVQQTGVFTDCEETLQRVRELLESCTKTGDNRLKNAARRIAWPLKEKEVLDCLRHLSRIRGILSAAVQANSA
jgi:hypothetical protein